MVLFIKTIKNTNYFCLLGFMGKEIAHKLQISIHTVNIHRQNLLHKLEAQNSIEAINKGIGLGILK